MPDVTAFTVTGEDHDAMALIAGQYIYELLHREPITTYMTTLDLHNLSLESAPIGAERLRAFLN